MRKFILVLLVSFTATHSFAQEYPNPLEFMESKTQMFFTILDERNPEDPTSVENTRKQLRTELFNIFDLKRVAVLALGRNMRQLSKDQLERFSEQFGELMFLTYLENIESYTNEKFIFEKYTPPEKNKSMVSGVIKTSTNEYPFEYFIILNNNKWQIYNIKVEGVSLIQNYRTQFREYMINNGPEELIVVVKEKVNELQKKLYDSTAD